MSEEFKIVLTSALTILGGIFVYTTGQIISKFFIEPIHDQSRCIGDISDSLIFYANQFSNPGVGKPEKMDETQKVLRQRASQLTSKTHVINCYKLFELLGIVPKRSAVIEASRSLIKLSNSVHEGDGAKNDELREKIENLLNIRTHY
ncbi:hypothetical protein DRP07_02495 [Archaeoglobales archaeon]|nr:MAG: hypothetical protein DRP07_02495 [Archaeoglobales archaeon]